MPMLQSEKDKLKAIQKQQEVEREEALRRRKSLEPTPEEERDANLEKLY